MGLFLAIMAFWSAVYFGGRHARKWWLQRRLLQPVNYLSEIKGMKYYQQLSSKQFENLIMKAARVRGFVVFDDPYFGRSKNQGYIWKKGKKYVIVQHTDGPLSEEKLQGIAKSVKLARADQAMVFHPFPDASNCQPGEIQLLSGAQLIAWFSVLDRVRPPLPRQAPSELCECGSPVQARINPAGSLLLVCNRYPVCRKGHEVAFNGQRSLSPIQSVVS